jgi:hypothetical protein
MDDLNQFHRTEMTKSNRATTYRSFHLALGWPFDPWGVWCFLVYIFYKKIRALSFPTKVLILEDKLELWQFLVILKSTFNELKKCFRERKWFNLSSLQVRDKPLYNSGSKSYTRSANGSDIGNANNTGRVVLEAHEDVHVNGVIGHKGSNVGPI